MLTKLYYIIRKDKIPTHLNFTYNLYYNQLYSLLVGFADSTTNITPIIFQEKTSSQRFLRLANPVFRYDFKVGNYMSDDTKKMNLHLFRTIQDLTTGVRKSS